jgi:hypothetical protein
VRAPPRPRIERRYKLTALCNALIRVQGQPVAHWLEHKREVMSVDWSSLRKEQLVSSSWDGSLKLVSVSHTSEMQDGS